MVRQGRCEGLKAEAVWLVGRMVALKTGDCVAQSVAQPGKSAAVPLVAAKHGFAGHFVPFIEDGEAGLRFHALGKDICY